MKPLLNFILITFCSFLSGQNEGFKLSATNKMVIPFQLINNLIFIPVSINGVELTFLLDSGVQESILFSLENKDVTFKNTEKIKFSGLGGNVDLSGLKSINNDFKIGKNFEDRSHTIFIILNEEFNFSSHVGIPVNGIIGYNFFKNDPVEIDYIKKKITIYSNNKAFQKRAKKYKSFDISLEDKKPYINVDVKLISEAKNSKMLLDLGNSDAIWLFPKMIENFSYNRPNIQDYLGRGFNGDIYGKRSRIKEMSIGDFSFTKPLTAMPDELSFQHLKMVKNRVGSVGSDILRRFNVIFDYPNQKIYLKKNRNFDEPFLFNMSGLDIKNDGMEWDSDLVRVETKEANTNNGNEKIYSAVNEFQYKFTLKPIYSVAASRENSPGYNSGIRKDDEIVKINNKKASTFTLQQILDLLKSSEGKQINIEVRRKFQILSFKFTLEDPIPYEN
ncbi:aspartyl protease family protein [Halpernia frigidisoli]|uniref:Aspartyl protease n=1 Tax=Halpernia frigidisoli TaxID=1125876 RepID=A0A1I3F8V5_9FLAO|nr:aspartyl protease family protein [Halpernia frigidisoli]SFI07628.1 Aspartyl protease [Halpernia frigidisoli]